MAPFRLAEPKSQPRSTHGAIAVLVIGKYHEVRVESSWRTKE
jgi:hypothetical protein